MRAHWILSLAVAVTTSAYCAQRVTVKELTQRLISLHDASKSDAEVAASLQELQLSEELTASQADGLKQYLRGSLSFDQLTVLRGLSEFEPAAPSQLSTPPALDAAAQSALLARTGTWAANTLQKAPNVTASEKVDTFEQDTQGGNSSHQAEESTKFDRPTNEHTDDVEIAQGVKKAMNPAPKVNWGENGKTSEVTPSPALAEIFQAASALGKPAFSRWELIEGKPVAVFTFAVEKKSHYLIEFCCFPFSDTQDPGGGFGGSAPVVAPGANTKVTSWKPFKKTVPFHGLLYIDPDSGAILRTVTFAELKPSDYVHNEDVKVDYATETVDGKTCVVPVRRVTLNETVPGGDTGPKSYPIRRELITAEYANFRIATQ